MPASPSASKVVLRVDPATARAYNDASDEEKERARSAFELALSGRREESRQKAASELIHLMDEIGIEAEARGLTEEKLDSLLREIDEERDAELDRNRSMKRERSSRSDSARSDSLNGDGDAS